MLLSPALWDILAVSTPWRGKTNVLIIVSFYVALVSCVSLCISQWYEQHMRDISKTHTSGRNYTKVRNRSQNYGREKLLICFEHSNKYTEFRSILRRSTSITVQNNASLVGQYSHDTSQVKSVLFITFT